MKQLVVNDWMARDMIGYLYFAVYAISETEWWLYGGADTIKEAQAILSNEMADAEEDDEGEWMIIDFEGKQVNV